MPMVTIRKIDTLAELSTLAQAWDALLKQSYADNIFLTWTWIECWSSVFHQRHKLYVLVAESEGALVGLAPLMQTDQGGKICLEFIGTPEADYADFILPAERADLVADFIDFINAHPQDWSSIRLSQLPSLSPSLAVLRKKLPTSNWRHRIETTDVCPAYVVESLDETERARFSIKKGKAIRNNINRFKKEGEFELVLLRDPDSLAKHLPGLFNYHIRRWESTDTPSRFLQPDHQKFCLELAKRPGLTQHIMIFSLIFKNLPIAYFLCFDYGGKVGLYTPAHSAYFHRRSPGQILNYFVIENLVRSGSNCIDFMRGGEQYKKRFTNQTTENVRVVIFTSALDYLRLRFRQVVKNVSLARTIHQFLVGRKSVATTTTVHTGQKREYGCSTLKHAPEIGTRNTVKRLGVESIGRICSFLGLEADSERHLQIEKRFETGANCFVFEKQDRIAALVWTRETKETKKTKETEAGSLQTILFDFETSEATDGEACHISLVAEVAKIFLESGRSIVALAHDDETAFLKALTSVGFEVSAKS